MAYYGPTPLPDNAGGTGVTTGAWTSVAHGYTAAAAQTGGSGTSGVVLITEYIV
jgi:hypothetical protein